MSAVLKIILGIAFLAILLGGLSVFVGQTNVNVQLSHLGAVFDMIAGNINALNEMFPVKDLLLAFSAVISIEAIILGVKIYKFIKGHFISKD